MSTTERKNGIVLSREILASLNVTSEDRVAILNDDLVARIGTILGQTASVNPNLFYKGWHLESPTGTQIELCSYETVLGRVSSADILAGDSIDISYTEDGEIKKSSMKGISDIALLKHIDGTETVEFVQKTDKQTHSIKVSNKAVSVSGKRSPRNIPRRYVKDFSFI